MKNLTYKKMRDRVRSNILNMANDDYPNELFNIMVGENNVLSFIAELEGHGKLFQGYMKRCMLEVDERRRKEKMINGNNTNR